MRGEQLSTDSGRYCMQAFVIVRLGLEWKKWEDRPAVVIEVAEQRSATFFPREIRKLVRE